MAVGRMLNRWLGVFPGVVAVVAASVFGVPAYGQHTHPSGGAGGGVSHMGGGIPHPPPHISAPAPRPQQPSPPRPQSVEPRNQAPIEHSAGGAVPGGMSPGGASPGGAPGNRLPTGGQSTGGQPMGGQPAGGQAAGGQFQSGQSPGGQFPNGVTATRVPHPPISRRWPLPQGASESDRPPPGQCRVWLNGVPGSRQPAPTSCGQASKMRTPGSTLIFGDDGSGPPSGPQGRSP
jgi:hypothetical protein